MRLSTKNSKLSTSQGFTLIEAVVSAALFAFVMASVVGIYLGVLKLNSRTRAERALAQNARFITEYLSKEVRNGHIDYTQTNTAQNLYLVNQNNDSERIYLSNNLSNCATAVCNLMLTKNSGTATALNSDSVRVTNLQFIVSPSADPFVIANNTHLQPHVTLILELTANINSRDNTKINIQSTFTQLYYPARQ